jgi:hypothetical protein
MRAWEPEFIRLWQDGASLEAIAAAQGIPPGTVKSRASSLQREGKITPRPRGGARPRPQVPQSTHVSPPSRVPQGTQQPGVSQGTPTPAEVTVKQVADAVEARFQPWMQRVVDALERAPEETPEWIPVQVDPGAFRGHPKGTPGYPEHPEQDSRQNLHLPAGERWEFRAVAKGLKLDPSVLFRRLWRGYMQSPQAREALQRYVRDMGISRGTPEGGEDVRC